PSTWEIFIPAASPPKNFLSACRYRYASWAGESTAAETKSRKINKPKQRLKYVCISLQLLRLARPGRVNSFLPASDTTKHFRENTGLVPDPDNLHGVFEIMPYIALKAAVFE